MKKNVKRALAAATTGFLIGGAISYVVVNATAEHRSLNDVYNLHDDPLHYAIDAACGVACAAMSAMLSSIGRGRSTNNEVRETHTPLLTGQEVNFDNNLLPNPILSSSHQQLSNSDNRAVVF